MLSHSVVSDSLRSHALYPARLLYPWEFSRQEYWSRLPCPLPGDLPNPGIEPKSPALQEDSLPTETPGKPQFIYSGTERERERVCVCVWVLSHVQLFATSWTAAHQASLSIANSWSLLKLMSIEWMMPSNYLILCRPLLPLAFNLSQHQGLFQ